MKTQQKQKVSKVLQFALNWSRNRGAPVRISGRVYDTKLERRKSLNLLALLQCSSIEQTGANQTGAGPLLQCSSSPFRGTGARGWSTGELAQNYIWSGQGRRDRMSLIQPGCRTASSTWPKGPYLMNAVGNVGA